MKAVGLRHGRPRWHMSVTQPAVPLLWSSRTKGGSCHSLEPAGFSTVVGMPKRRATRSTLTVKRAS
eukprot:2139907-Lingulodinium_polyedra.AAC.1